MERYEVGSFVKSKAGHDKDDIYIIIGYCDEKVLLVDGKYKKVENPKLKNPKHVQWIKYRDENLDKKFSDSGKITNEEIKYAIKCYKKNTKVMEEM